MKALQQATPPLTQAKVTVLVEDVLTEAFFIHVFLDPRLKFVTAGGKRALRSLLYKAPHTQLFPRTRVLGVCDRDFDTDNFAAWHDPSQISSPELILPVHEVENLLLDFDLLAQLASGESAQSLHDQAQERARALVPWLSCRAVIDEIQKERGRGFPTKPPQPPQGIDSITKAASHIADQRPSPLSSTLTTC